MNDMSPGFDFHPRWRGPRPVPWRDLDAAVARWVLAHGGSRALATIAAWASFAEGEGDAALMLTDATAARLGISDIDALRIAIGAEADDAGNRWLARAEDCADAGDAIADAKRMTPFVLDGDAFYLRRNFQHETAVARLLRARLPARDDSTPPGLDDDALRELFEGSWRSEEAAQREAVRRVQGKRLFVLSGGPGTGKTSTVKRMLLALARDHATRHGGVAPRLRLAAPTGKAAQRLGESLRDAALAAETSTLHRLLDARGGGFVHHRDNRLPADIVVVDEASMVDLALLRALLEALPDAATLVLVGDEEQLAPVSTGNVLADLVGALEGGEHLVRLHHSFRADPGLARINEAVRAGDVGAFADAWQCAGACVARHPVADGHDLSVLLSGWTRRLQQVLRESGALDACDEAAAPAVLAAVKRQQLLCALREGTFGAVQASRVIEQRLRRDEALARWQDGAWYPGRAIIVLRNDEASGLFNGDVGLCLRLRGADGREHLQVVFDAASGTGIRRFDPEALPAHETAFALTVHKSQGSEYDRIAVLLPPDPEHRLLSRQLLYTAISRARQGMELWTDDGVLRACLARPLLRAGRLRERLSTPAPA